MVAITRIEGANKSRSSRPKVAVFVGATSGIGLGTIEALLRTVKGCTIFIIGRSQQKFAGKISRLESLDPTANINFIEAQVSLLQDIDRVCNVLLERIKVLDILWLSQGGLGLREGDGATAEGLPTDFAVVHYGRAMFMKRLAPLLNKSSDGRVLSCLCAGLEGQINLTDPGLRNPENYATAGFWGAQKQGITMQSLIMAHLARESSTVSFIHTNPGMVSTDVHAKWSTTFTGWWRPLSWLLSLFAIPLMHLAGFTPEQAGEVGLFELLDERFGSEAGSNFHRLDDHAEEIAANEAAVLAEHETASTGDKIWEHTNRVFDEVLSSR